jgi:major intracellular serine protease
MNVSVNSVETLVWRRPRALFLAVAGCSVLGTIIQSCCEVSAASEIESLAGSQLTGCTANHAKGQLSVKVSDSVAGWENDLLSKTWNGALKTFVKPSVLSLKSVESVGTTPNSSAPDNIRYVQLDGKFGDGIGVGTKVLGTLFKKGNKGSGILGTNTIDDIQESLEVKSPPDSEAEVLQKNFSLQGLMENLTWQHPDAPSSFFADYNSEEQWSFAQTGYDQAITYLLSEANALNKPTIRVAVLDTGVDVNHPDLRDAVEVSLAYNALTGESGTAESVKDLQGHGTHVAGIIAGQGKATETMTPVFGVAYKFNVKIVPIKVLGDDGTGSTVAMSKGIRWAQKNKVDVISMSLGSGSNYDCLKEQGLKDPVIDEVIQEGIIVVAAAGNETCELGGACTSGGTFDNYTVLPCANEGTLCVASNTWTETESTFSNYASAEAGSQSYRTAPDITAPGDRIISTYPLIEKFAKYQGVSILSGTSMATPYISGIAAILKTVATDKYPVTQETFKKYLQESSFQSEVYKGKFQAGRVDLKALADNRKNVYIGGGSNLERGTERPVTQFKYGK